jgi:hypothetical protein
VLGLLTVPAVIAALVIAPFHATSTPLSAPVRSQLRHEHFWHQGCPVALTDLRLLTVSYWDFSGHARTGRLVVNRNAAVPLQRVLGRLYGLHFPIRHLDIKSMYGPAADRPRDGDVSGSFDCRQAVPSPCVGGTGTGSWSMHAYGLAVDINPVENPYVGCGQSRDPATRPYFDRSRHRKGMVTRRVVDAFGSIGWGWGGAWPGNTKDYMHFSSNGT